MLAIMGWGLNPPTIFKMRRSLQDLDLNQRSALLSQLYKAAEAAAPPNYPPEALYSPAAVWGWCRNYLAYVVHKKHDFVPYTASPKHAVYDLSDQQGSTQSAGVSLAGDWGTGTLESNSVASQITRCKPNFTIHLGDIYYVGDPPSVNENCLGIVNPNNNYTPVTWPIGSVGSFAMNGNHEMYANGVGYFDVFLPRLGVRAGAAMSGQQTSFFCIQNDYWRIIAIDTGYNSIGFPVLSQIPVVNDIPGIGGNCELRPELLDWIGTVVKPRQDPRAVVLLSHHQDYSAFQNDYKKPAQQLWDAGLQRPVLWFWGHEHRLAGYDLWGSSKLKSYGRCIGHGGMPVDRGAPTHHPTPVFYDNRQASNGFGVNGFVNLWFSRSELTAEYVDMDGTRILSEHWNSSEKGTPELLSRKKLIDHADFHVQEI
jgi:Calcineurin-like phosphoesterase